MSYTNNYRRTPRRIDTSSLEALAKSIEYVLDEHEIRSQREFQVIQETQAPINSTVTIISGGGGGGSSSVSNLYANQAAVSATATPIAFPSPITNPIILYRCVNSLNQSVGCDLSSITTSGFTATALEASTLYFCVFSS